MTRWMPPDRSLVMGWVHDGTDRFVAEVEGADLAAPSRLPGWSNGHVAAHIAQNATALVRLLTWARTGVRTPMYASREARSADIEHDAALPRDRQLAALRATARDLDDAVDAMTGPAWSAVVAGASGRPMTADVVPWMRVREVWLHTVDLGAPITVLPAALLDAFLDDVVEMMADRTPPPNVRLVASTGAERTIGGGSVTVSGDPAELLGWLVGRVDGSTLHTDGDPPDLPAWL